MPYTLPCGRNNRSHATSLCRLRASLSGGCEKVSPSLSQRTSLLPFSARLPTVCGAPASTLHSPIYTVGARQRALQAQASLSIPFHTHTYTPDLLGRSVAHTHPQWYLWPKVHAARLTLARMPPQSSMFHWLYQRLPDEEELAENERAEVDARAEEVTTEMRGKGFVPLTAEDLATTPGVIDAAKMQREGGAGTVSLPPTIYAGPIVLTLAATPGERRSVMRSLALLGPVWLSLGISIAVQLTFSYYMHASVVHLVTDDLVAECEADTSAILRNVALFTFVAMVISDVVETFEIRSWLRALPASELPESMRLLRFTEEEEPPKGKSTL
eukprot:1203401-Prymnesium_polylepis.1